MPLGPGKGAEGGGERRNVRVAVLQKLRVCCRLWPFGASLRGVCRQEKKNIWEASSISGFGTHLFTAPVRALNISSLLKCGHNESRSAHLCQGGIGNAPGALGPCLICISFTQMFIKINALRHNICPHSSLLDRRTATAPGEPRPPHPPPHAQLHRPHAAPGSAALRGAASGPPATLRVRLVCNPRRETIVISS